MALKFIYGNSGSGKTKYSIDKLIELSKDPQRRMYYCIVPEQFTLKTQQAFTDAAPGGVIMNIDVVSFGRLAYRVFDELGIEASVMEETGKDLVLRRLAAQEMDSLKVFKNKLKKMGYVDQIKSVITELMQYDISPEELKSIIDEADDQPNLKFKLNDIHTMYQAFTDYMEGRFVVAEQVLDILVGLVEESALLKDAVILLDGFTGFTPIQMKLIGRLMGVVKDIYVTVTLDCRENPFSKRQKQDLFYMSSKMVGDLSDIARELAFAVDAPEVIAPSADSRHGSNATLAFLENNIFRYTKKPMADFDREAIKITSLDNPVKEVCFTASQILKLIQEKDYKYKDFAVVCADVETYEKYAKGIFDKYEIPCYIDVKKPVIDNPFISFLRSAMQMIVKDFSYESVFAFLRTNLTDIDINDIDELENYCIAKGIKGKKRWSNTFKSASFFGSGIKLDEDEIARRLSHVNEIRKSFWNTVKEFAEGFDNKELTIRDMTISLYKLCVVCDIENKLEQKAESFEAAGEELLRDEYKQIYRYIMELLEKTVDLLGDEVISAKDYADILDAGFAGAKLGMIPTDGDCVILGDIERTRLDDVKVLFLIGANDSLIPKKTDRESILSQFDRDYLEKMDVELSPSPKEEAFSQRFYLYLNLTKPSDALYISYSRTGSDGKSASPSYLTALIKKMYDGLEVTDIGDDYSWPALNTGSAVDAYVAGLGTIREAEPSREWKALRKWMLESEKLKDLATELYNTAFIEAGEETLSKKAAEGIYGKTLAGSVSKLEKYIKCAFSYFLQYGLKLSDRETYDFNSSDFGDFCHAIMKEYSERVDQSSEYSWSDITQDNQQKLLDAVIEDIILKMPNESLAESERGRYAIERVRNLMRRSIWAVTEQIRAGEFVPYRYEMPFKTKDLFDNDENMMLSGIIDRLDICETDDKVYARIIDYKTGNKNLTLTDIYFGHQLQLILYLNAAIDELKKEFKGKEVLPGGAFYMHLDDAMLPEPAADDKIGDELFKTYKLNGILTSEDDMVHKMDSSAGRSSDVFKRSASGVIRELSGEQFDDVRIFVDGKAAMTGADILKGNIEINPFRRDDNTGCDYCSFRGVCGFDMKISGYEFNDLPKLKDEEVLEKINE